jgi:L-gulonate 3-dehydrogenase
MSEEFTPTISTVAVVGTGVIGRSWIVVFARAGCETRAWDPDAAQMERAASWLDAELSHFIASGELTLEAGASWRGRVRWAATLDEAVGGAGYVQESGPEQLDIKRQAYAELDRVAGPEVIIGSSTSALDMTAIAAGLPGAARCIVAHPVNPPHVIPVVEVLGGAMTATETVERTCAFLTSVGQTPVRLKRYAPGFILNRMQAALVREAVNLVAEEVADAEAVDAVIRDGLGLRWALMGPFAVASANANGGAREYFTRYGASYNALWQDLRTDTELTADLVRRIGDETEAMLGGVSVADLMTWRDKLILGIRHLKAQHPLHGKE